MCGNTGRFLKNMQFLCYGNCLYKVKQQNGVYVKSVFSFWIGGDK
jgi:hypothetical protein